MRNAVQTLRLIGQGGVVLNRMLHLIVPTVLFVLIAYAVGSEEILSRIRSVAPGWILAAFLLAQVQIVLSALRWQLTAQSIGVILPFGRALSEYYLSGAINMTVLGGVLGDGIRAFRSRGGKGLEAAAHAVLIERLAGQVALAVVLAAGLLLSGHSLLQGAGLLLLAVLAAGALLGSSLRHIVPLSYFPDVFRRFSHAVRRTWFTGRLGIVQILLSLLIVAANLASFAFCAAATGSRLGLIEILYAVPLILLAMLIPFSVAGWGYREGAAAGVFALIGATAGAGVSASVVFGAVILVANLPGLVVLMVRKRGSATVARNGDGKSVD